jgi:hypothetical protein
MLRGGGRLLACEELAIPDKTSGVKGLGHKVVVVWQRPVSATCSFAATGA